MLNFNKITVILVLFVLFFVLTDSKLETLLKNNLWSFWGTTVNETSEITNTAPSTVMENLESVRISFVGFLDNQVNNLLLLSQKYNQPLSILFYLLSVLLKIISFFSSFVIIFYPSLIVLLYYFFTSNLFKKKNYY